MSCTEVREHLLDHVYGACDDAVATLIDAHLPGCDGCREALAAAHRERSLLAEAAALPGPALELQTRYAGPESRAKSPESRVQGPESRAPRRRWVWHVAAAVLVVVGGVLGWRAWERAGVAAQYPSLVVRGPAVLPASGGQLTVEAWDAWDRPAAADISARILDARGKLVGQAAGVPGAAGTVTLSVPGDVGKPGEYLAVQIAATFHGGGEPQRRLLTPILLRDAHHLLARVATDKPLYRPGEVVRARLLALERESLRPAGAVPMRVKLKDPRGSVVQESAVPSQDGVSACAWQLDGGAVGGEWSIECSHDDGAFPVATRTFLVRAYQQPRLRTELKLDRDSYAPGESGHAWLTVERAEGGVPVDAPCEVALTVDGMQTSKASLTLPATGLLRVPFTLPAAIEEGRGVLSVVITDGGVVETATKTLPISLDRLDVSFFPEGGDLVAGLPNRVYFEVRDSLDEPADLTIELLDGDRVVATGRVVKRGMGVLEITPRAGASYRLRAAQPPVKLRGEFPAAVAEGVTLRALDVETAAGAPLRVEVGSTTGGEFTLALVCRGAQVGTAGVRVAAGATAEAAIPVAGGVGGVLRVTVFDAAGMPRGERLVNVAPSRRLAVEIKPERERYAPGESVSVSVTARDESGKPAAGAVLGAAVVNQAVIDFAHDDDTPDLPMHFLLGLEVKELEEVEVYADGPDAKRAVDLLLGVQGWRRFAWRDAAAFVAANPDDGPRVAAVSASTPAPLFIDTRPHVRASLREALGAVDARIGAALLPALAIGLMLLVGGGVAYAVLFTMRRSAAFRGPRIFGGLTTSAVSLAVLMWGIVSATGGVRFGAGGALGAAAAPSPNVVMGQWQGNGGAAEAQPRLQIVNGTGWVVLDDLTVGPADNPGGGFGDQGFTLMDATVLSLTSETSGTPVADPGVVVFGPALAAPDNGFSPPQLWPATTARGTWDRPPATFTLTGQLVTPRSRHRLVRVRGGNGGSPFGLSSVVDANGNPVYLVDADGDGVGDLSWLVASQKWPAEWWARWWDQHRFTHTRVLTREHRQWPPQSEADDTRRDFTEVLYWNPLLVTNERGEATFTFDTCDAIASFRIGIDAHDARGALASEAGSIQNRVPFYLEPKLPVALSAGDRLLLPVAIVNDTESESTVTTTVSLDGSLLTLDGRQDREVAVAAGGRTRVLYPITAQDGVGEVKIKVAGRGPANHADASEHTIPVQPRGYPVTIDASGVLERRDSVTVLMPEAVAAGTLQGSLRLYPNLLATLTDGLEGMLQSPGGCFEQASSTNYPNVLVLDYLAQGDEIVPAVAQRARGLLEQGYRLLTGYECRQRGYEWFGSDPGHEALTAYGLVEFVDMAKVWRVDPTMIARTRDWLLARRDGKGGFLRDPKALDGFGRAGADVTDAYITWALTESSPNVDLTAELDRVEQLAAKSDDPYLLALAANALANARRPSAAAVRERLASKQAAGGSVPGARTSITSSGGDDLVLETTAFAALAFLRDERTQPEAESAVRWILQHREGSGRFGATQATIMALRALVAHARATRRTACDHTLTVLVNGAPVAERHVPAGTPGVVPFERELLAALRPGENRIELRTTGAETLPWALGVTYRTLQPPTHPECAVRVTTALSAATATEGETLRCTVTVRNITGEPVPMTLARVGLPAGLSPRVEQLKELREAGLVGLYETGPREVTLYWRGIEANGAHTVHLDLVAEIPGTFEGPATRAYLYYTDERQAWAAPLRVDVAPRG